MTYTVPRQIKAGRAIKINGVTYSKDQVLTAAQVAAIPRLGALLSSGRLVAVPDVHDRKAVRGNRTPTNVPPVALAVLTSTPDFSATTTFDPVTHLKVTLAIAGGDGPFTVDWGDSSTSEVKGRTKTHTYATAGAKTITVTGENGDTCTVSVTTVAPPVAAFTATPTLLSVAFDSTITGSTSQAWDFGDTGTSTSADPTHVYAGAGTYTVTLTATGAGGVTTVTHDVTVAAA